MLKSFGRLMTALTFLILTGVAVGLARFANKLVFSFYPQLSAALMGKVAGVTARVPFCVAEVLLILVLLVIVVQFFRLLFKGRILRWLTGVVLFLCVVLFVFVIAWGLNHFAPPLYETLELEMPEQFTSDQMEAAAQYFLEQANATADSVSRDSSGQTSLPGFDYLAGESADGFAALGQQYEIFQGSNSAPKKSLLWYPMSKAGLTGLFWCYTGEACVNPDTYPAALPFVMCHEVSHRMSIASEDAANYAAFLACIANPSADFQYSGWYSAFLYTYNAVAEVDQVAAADLWNAMGPGLKADVLGSNSHYAQYEGRVQDVVQTANDTYLKAFSENLGVQSYGAVSDYLFAWYLQEIAPPPEPEEAPTWLEQAGEAVSTAVSEGGRILGLLSRE